MPPKKPTATETSMRKGMQPLGYAARPETRMPGIITSPAAKLRGESPATSKVNLEDLRAYNASQTPGPSFRDRMRGVTSQGRFGVDTANGVIAARGAGPEGGSGGSGTDEVVPMGQPMAFAAEAMRPAPKAGQSGPAVAFAAESMAPQAPPPAPAFAAEAMRPAPKAGQSGPAVAFAAESMAPQAPPPAPASVQKAVRQSLTQAPGRQQMSMSLRAPGEVGSAGVMTQQARLRGMAEASQLGLPPATEAAVRQQVLAGDYGAAGRAQQALASLPPGAMAAGRSATLDRELAAHVIAGGAPVAEKKAADKMRYQETALRNTRAAQAGSAAAIDLGLDPLAQPGQIRATQQQRLRAGMGKVDSQTLMAMLAKDPTNVALQGALAQSLEHERKKGLNDTVRAQALKDRERQQRQEDDWLKYQRDYQLQVDKTALDNQGRMRAGLGGRGQAAYNEHDMNEAYRDYMRQPNPLNEPRMSRDEFEQVMWQGYDQGVLGKVERAGMGVLNSLGNVLTSPMQGLGQMPQAPMQHTAPASLAPPGMQAQPFAGGGVGLDPMAAQHSPTTVPQHLADMSPQVLVHLDDLTPQQRAKFDTLDAATQRALLKKAAGGA